MFNINKNKTDKEITDFKQRATDIIIDAKHRKLENVDIKEVTQIIQNCASIEEEQKAFNKLKNEQQEDYAEILSNITENNEFLQTLNSLEMPEEFRLYIENKMRQKKDMEQQEQIAYEDDEYLVDPE